MTIRLVAQTAAEYHPALGGAFGGPKTLADWRQTMSEEKQTSPTLRLAVCPPRDAGGANTVEHHVGAGGLGHPPQFGLAATTAMLKDAGQAAERYPFHVDSPTVRLAHVDGAQGDCVLKGAKGVDQIELQHAPALLVSYYYLEPFERNRHLYRYRDWVMDSGAFSAHNSGKHIDLQKYIDKCIELLQSDPTLSEVFSLDVIPADHKPTTVQHAAEQSLKNCEEMWRQGVPAIPTFHRGEQEDFLYAMAKTYPKIAIGGVAMLRGDQKFLFCEQVFARVWPKKIHGLGMSSEELVYKLPFHSVDATNWELAPCAFGNWQKFGSMSVRGSNQDLRSQVKFYLDMESKARVRWAKEMKELDALAPSAAVLGPCASPAERLAMRSTGRELVGHCEPDGRLAVAFQHDSGDNLVNGTRVAFEKNPASTASRTVGADAVDAGAAGGQHALGAFGKTAPTPKPTPKPAPKPKPPEEKKLPAEMEDKWKDYWKDRLK